MNEIAKTAAFSLVGKLFYTDKVIIDIPEKKRRKKQISCLLGSKKKLARGRC